MKWIEPKYSKSRVRKAGEVLLRTITNKKGQIPGDLNMAMKVLSNWRAAHAYPMHAIRILVRRTARKVDKKANVVQRLKRTPSIIWKLARFPTMGLDRMQDIGGCRAVVKNLRCVKKLAGWEKRSGKIFFVM